MQGLLTSDFNAHFPNLLYHTAPIKETEIAFICKGTFYTNIIFPTNILVLSCKLCCKVIAGKNAMITQWVSFSKLNELINDFLDMCYTENNYNTVQVQCTL